MQEARTYNVYTSTTVTDGGVSTQGTGDNLNGFIVLVRPAVAATFLMNITSASGTFTCVIQRGIHAPIGDNGLPTTATPKDIQWFDYASFTTTTATGRRILPVVYTSTANDSAVTSTGAMLTNTQLSGPLGTLFRGAHRLSGASPSYTFSVVGEFEF